jgi:hypothetical protein
MRSDCLHGGGGAPDDLATTAWAGLPPASCWKRPTRLVSSQRVLGGVVHKLPEDLRKALVANSAALDAWKDHLVRTAIAARVRAPGALR